MGFVLERSEILKFLDGFIDEPPRKHGLLKAIAPGVVTDGLIGRFVGRDAYQKACFAWTSAFPDWRVERKKVKLFGNVAVVVYEYSGTHKRKYQRPPIEIERGYSRLEKLLVHPSGSKIENLKSECVYVFDDTHLLSMHTQSDFETFYQQLGGGSVQKSDVQQEVMKLSSQYTVSKREVHCLALTLIGCTSKHVGSLLFISPRTVESHLQHAYVKLECNGKQQCFEKMLSDQSFPLWQLVGNALLKAE